jgi:hypothetical protein
MHSKERKSLVQSIEYEEEEEKENCEIRCRASVTSLLMERFGKRQHCSDRHKVQEIDSKQHGTSIDPLSIKGLDRDWLLF